MIVKPDSPPNSSGLLPPTEPLLVEVDQTGPEGPRLMGPVDMDVDP